MLRLFKNFSYAMRGVIVKPHNSLRSFASEVTPKNFVELDRDKKIKIIELEISLLHQAGRKAPDPSKIKPETWELLLNLQTKSAREREYEFLWLNEQKKNSDAAKKERKKAENKLRLEQKAIEIEENKHIQYGLGFNRLLLRIEEKAIKRHYNNKLIKAMMFDQKLIFDCSYDDYMSPKEAKYAADQLRRSFADNRLHSEPFDLHFCNFNLSSIASKALHKFFPTMLEPAFPMNIHSESLTEKFEKDRLVYLTPHCKKELLEYSHDDIYIIGAMVDMSSQGPLSLAKAKNQGLRMAKLPLDRYLSWKTSKKSLTMDQMVKILLEMKKFGDWNRALRFVPKRKITEYPTNHSFMKRDSIKQHENLNGFITSSEPRRFSYEKSENIQWRQRQHENLNGFVTSSEPRRFSYEKSENIQRRQRQHENLNGFVTSSEPRRFSYEKSENIQRRQRQHENLNGFVTSSEPRRFSYEKSENIQRLQTYEPRTSFSYKKGGVDKHLKKFKISELDLSLQD